MTSILACCTFCGDVTLRPDEITLIHSDQTTFSFDCPVCETRTEYEAAPLVVAVLRALGCDEIEAVLVGDTLDAWGLA